MSLVLISGARSAHWAALSSSQSMPQPLGLEVVLKRYFLVLSILRAKHLHTLRFHAPEDGHAITRPRQIQRATLFPAGGEAALRQIVQQLDRLLGETYLGEGGLEGSDQAAGVPRTGRVDAARVRFENGLYTCIVL